MMYDILQLSIATLGGMAVAFGLASIRTAQQKNEIEWLRNLLESTREQRDSIERQRDELQLQSEYFEKAYMRLTDYLK